MRVLVCAFLLAAPAMAEEAVPLCTDRPTKSNFACTVPEGRVQVEADALAWATSRGDGARTDQLSFTNPTIKYGLTDSTDVQVNWVPFTRVRSRDVAGGVSTLSGVGDVVLRLKQRLTAADAGFQLAVLPFVKLPTARTGIGNGKVEGGVAVPVNIGAAGGWTVTLGPQLDVLADLDGDGHHVGLTGLVNIAKQFGPVTLYNELWTSQNYDPAGTVRQYSYDVALAWLATPMWQIDVGANIGLNRNTPDLVSYVGVSTRF